jgi:hypothetical protein
MKMETCSSETSIYFQKTTRCFIPEDINLKPDVERVVGLVSTVTDIFIQFKLWSYCYHCGTDQ